MAKIIMKLWELNQIQDRDTALFVHTTIIRAISEKDARLMAQENEDENRYGAIKWDKQNATCEILSSEGNSEIILCA